MRMFGGKKDFQGIKEELESSKDVEFEGKPHGGGNMRLFSAKELKEEREKNLETLRLKELSLAKSIQTKTQEFNQANETLDAKIKDKQAELDRLKEEHLRFTASERSEISSLEDRRKAALAPIEKERREVEDMKLEATRCLLQLGEKQLSVASQMELLRREMSDMAEERLTLDKVRSETLATIASDKAKAEQAIKSSEAVIKALQEEREASNKAYEAVSERLRVAELAEANVRAAMLVADERLKKEKLEQKKTDDKRKALATAIVELKRRGLWNQKLENRIK